MPCSGCGGTTRGTVAAPRKVDPTLSAAEIAARMPRKPVRRPYDVMDSARRK